MAKIKSCKDLLMLLLYAKGNRDTQCESIQGRTRLMKMVFLFDKEVRKAFAKDKDIGKAIPKFDAYDFGPFSATVYSDLEFLVELGFVQVQRLSGGRILEDEVEEYRYWRAGADDEGSLYEEQFELTALGKEFVEEKLFGSLTASQKHAIDEFKAQCTGISLSALLKYVYAKYPKMTTRSRIRRRVLG